MRCALALLLSVSVVACSSTTPSPSAQPGDASVEAATPRPEGALAKPTKGPRSVAPRKVAGPAAWPQFAFSADNAASSTARVPSEPAQAWSTTLPTILAYASPVVADGRVFVMMYGAIGAYDARTGAQLWLNDTLKAGKYGTPAVAGNTLLVPAGASSASKVSLVAGLDVATGAVRWQSSEAQSWSTIKVDQGVAYASGAKMYALDSATGVTRWSADFGCITAPAIDSGLLYCAGTSQLVVADAATGAVRFRAPVKGALAVSTPAVVDGRVHLVGDGLLAYDAKDGHELWTAPFSAANRAMNGGTWIETSPAVADGRVFVIGTRGLEVFDAATGGWLWGVDVGVGGTSVAVSDGLVLVGADDLLDAATGASVWNSGVTPVWTTTPSIVDAWFYAADMERTRLRGFTGVVAGAP